MAQVNESQLSPSMDSLEINVTPSDFIDDTRNAQVEMVEGEGDEFRRTFRPDEVVPFHYYRHQSLYQRFGSLIHVYTDPVDGHDGLLGLIRLDEAIGHRIPDLIDAKKKNLKQCAVNLHTKYMQRINADTEVDLHPDNYGVSFTVRATDGSLSSPYQSLPLGALNFVMLVRPLNLTLQFGQRGGQEIWGFWIDMKITLLPEHRRRNMAKEKKKGKKTQPAKNASKKTQSDLRNSLDAKHANQAAAAETSEDEVTDESADEEDAPEQTQEVAQETARPRSPSRGPPTLPPFRREPTEEREDRRDNSRDGRRHDYEQRRLERRVYYQDERRDYSPEDRRSRGRYDDRRGYYRNYENSGRKFRGTPYARSTTPNHRARNRDDSPNQQEVRTNEKVVETGEKHAPSKPLKSSLKSVVVKPNAKTDPNADYDDGVASPAPVNKVKKSKKAAKH